jgi:hypothetical protein
VRLSGDSRGDTDDTAQPGMAAMKARPVDADGRLGLEVALMILLSLLLPSILWDHYLVIALFPLVAVYGHLVSTGRLLSWRTGALVVAAVLMSMPVLFWPAHLRQLDFRQGAGLLGMSPGLYGVLILFVLDLICLRDIRRSQAQMRPQTEAKSPDTISGLTTDPT